MKHTFKFLGLGAGIAVFSIFSACSSGTGTPAASSGGSSSVGDTGGAGGGTGTGGTTSTGTGTGGTSSTSPSSVTVFDSFDDSSQVALASLSNYVPPPTDCAVNVAVTNDAGVSVLKEWSGSKDVNADATPKGAMKITAVFTNWNQTMEIDFPAPTDSLGNPISFKDKILKAQIQLASGSSGNASYNFGAVLFVKTGHDSTNTAKYYAWGASAWQNLDTVGDWKLLQLDLDNVSGTPANKTFDNTDPVQLGIQISTGGAGETSYCNKDYKVAFSATPITSVIYIDQITYENRP